MKHAVIFKNTRNHWDNALPLGNGVFGCMPYYGKNRLTVPMNHYEVYYNNEENVLPEELLQAMPECDPPGTFHAEKRRQAELNQPLPGEPYTQYTEKKEEALHPAKYGRDIAERSYPDTGTLIFSFDSALEKADSALTLLTEDAKAVLTLEKAADRLTVDTIVARKDAVVNRICQSRAGLLRSIRLSMAACRASEPPEAEYVQLDSRTFAYTVTRKLSEKKPAFVFTGILRLIGAEGIMTADAEGMDIVPVHTAPEYTLVTAIFTRFQYENPLQDGLRAVNGYEAALDALYREHREYWDAFFTRSSIDVPDKFLELEYVINRYALDCCSGRGGVMQHQACGLNGLWDIRHPILWGSRWYWDVNIQAAYAGVFSGNQLELAKGFSDGMRSYVELARRHARNVHGMTGIASDYPFRMLYSCWFWCAQYLWFLYEYSMDEKYLREEAYPVFLELAEFALQLFEYDPGDGMYHIYPDASPEQGPLTHDSVITVACVKYLLRFTLQAAEILGDAAPILERCRDMAEKLPAYPESGDGPWGIHYRDSADAPDNLWLRHPSVLMPVFPIGECGPDSPADVREKFMNTVHYVEDRGEIGIFGGGWMAAAAARLGEGQTALRLLYERGMDHMLRSNGLTAEETDRFLNLCLMPRQPLYYPCMVEYAGEMPAAVNEMLLQSHDGKIRVFPALPDGNPELYRLQIHGNSYSEYTDRAVPYAAWRTVRFRNLLAKGAFEVSASCKDGVLEYIAVHSRRGGTARITSPMLTEDYRVCSGGKPTDAVYQDGLLIFETAEDGWYFIAREPMTALPQEQEEAYNIAPLSHLSYTKRRIFIGEDADTAYQKALDNFMRCRYFGNVRIDSHTMMKLDFGCGAEKDYAGSIPRQCYVAEENAVTLHVFVQLQERELGFTVKRGYGFTDTAGIHAADRGAPDCLRRDFVEGTAPAEFVIEAPRGQYELLVISGDAAEESYTALEAVNGRTAAGKLLAAGEFQAKVLPLVIEEDDEPIRLRISTKEGCKWKLNCLMLNGVRGY